VAEKFMAEFLADASVLPDLHRLAAAWQGSPSPGTTMDFFRFRRPFNCSPLLSR
jgi:hypothetical protein